MLLVVSDSARKRFNFVKDGDVYCVVPVGLVQRHLDDTIGGRP